MRKLLLKILAHFLKSENPDTLVLQRDQMRTLLKGKLTEDKLIAKEVIAGKWGSGDERKKKLTAAGYNYDTVQKKVNELLKTSTKKSVAEVAKEVVSGKWGNGADRKKKLKAAGYNYAEVQKEVNKLLK